ncbi:hypothetical protein FHT44_006315 [Mycolicibacterium sp. BK634]|uniref:hypothetical protein n=1 Tax=Mycolicibacterium sp. BK634 TaxID=2587099 RepID=UPI0016185C65|nr:hypothetical protein [Mycolicibacterium sp. BK634]MBB3753793.1 hypothetical protein [Mycolicibacterium sp. BK634]
MTTNAGDDYTHIPLGSGQLSNMPFLGYRLRESHLDTASTEPYIRAAQRWIAVWRSGDAIMAQIDVPVFNRYQPFAQLFTEDSDSEFTNSIPSDIASWLPSHYREPKGLPVVVRGNSFQALVSECSVDLYAGSTVAAAIKLLIHHFSEEMRRRIVHERSGLLEEALEHFRPEIRELYIPETG